MWMEASGTQLAGWIGLALIAFVGTWLACRNPKRLRQFWYVVTLATAALFIFSLISLRHVALILPFIAVALAGVSLAASVYVVYRRLSYGESLLIFSRNPDHCPQCGYDIRYTPGERCSECGWKIPVLEIKSARRPVLSRHRLKAIAVYLITAVVCIAILVVARSRYGRGCLVEAGGFSQAESVQQGSVVTNLRWFRDWNGELRAAVIWVRPSSRPERQTLIKIRWQTHWPPDRKKSGVWVDGSQVDLNGAFHVFCMTSDGAFHRFVEPDPIADQVKKIVKAHGSDCFEEIKQLMNREGLSNSLIPATRPATGSLPF